MNKEALAAALQIEFRNSSKWLLLETRQFHLLVARCCRLAVVHPDRVTHRLRAPIVEEARDGAKAPKRRCPHLLRIGGGWPVPSPREPIS